MFYHNDFISCFKLSSVFERILCRIHYELQLRGHAHDSRRLLLLQKKTIGILTPSKQDVEHCKPLFIWLGIMTIFSQYVLNCS